MTLMVILLSVGIIVGIIPSLGEQFSTIAKRLPEIQATLLKDLPAGFIHRAVQRFLQNPFLPPEHLFSAGQYAFGAVSEVVLIVALALYLAADRKTDL